MLKKGMASWNIYDPHKNRSVNLHFISADEGILKYSQNNLGFFTRKSWKNVYLIFKKFLKNEPNGKNGFLL